MINRLVFLFVVPTTEPLPVCPKNCSSCENGVCLVCESGFALVTGRKNNTICIPCATGRKGKRVDKSQCGSGNFIVVVKFSLHSFQVFNDRGKGCVKLI